MLSAVISSIAQCQQNSANVNAIASITYESGGCNVKCDCCMLLAAGGRCKLSSLHCSRCDVGVVWLAQYRCLIVSCLLTDRPVELPSFVCFVTAALAQQRHVG